MRNRKRLSAQAFKRRHPALDLDFKTLSGGLIVAYARKKGEEKAYAAASDMNLGKAIYQLSEACYRLAVLDAAERQGWRSGNTGEVGKPLQGHHVIHRAHGRNDSAENLSAVTAQVHSAQHEGRKS